MQGNWVCGNGGNFRKHYPLVKKLGMDISLVGSHGFKKWSGQPEESRGMHCKANRSHRVLREAGYKRVIAFTGMKEKDMDQDQAQKNCLECWKKILPLAEKKKITLCLEHLNSRDDSHPMKGHPGYFGDER